jgi:hypothetical protein
MLYRPNSPYVYSHAVQGECVAETLSGAATFELGIFDEKDNHEYSG